MCPTLGTTSSAINGMGMGLATMFVLICSNVVISLSRTLFRIWCVFLLYCCNRIVRNTAANGDAGLRSPLYATLGLFIPLIVVNCIVLGRAEALPAKIIRWHPCSTVWVWD